MKRSRNGLKALGLCVLALGLMAVAAGSAQAEPTSAWDVNGTSISAQLLPKLEGEIDVTKSKTVSLLSKALGGKKLEIRCTGFTLENVRLGVEGKVNLGKVKFTGCKLYIEEKEQAACEPNAGGTQPGVVEAIGTGLLELHEGVGITKLSPDLTAHPGGEFADIETSELCSVGESIPVYGNLTLLDSKLTTSQVNHLVEEGPLTNLWILAKELTVEHMATVDGAAIIKLAGEHTGLPWNGLPG